MGDWARATASTTFGGVGTSPHGKMEHLFGLHGVVLTALSGISEFRPLGAPGAGAARRADLKSDLNRRRLALPSPDQASVAGLNNPSIAWCLSATVPEGSIHEGPVSRRVGHRRSGDGASRGGFASSRDYRGQG